MKLQITVEGKAYEVEVEVLEEDEGVRPSSYTPLLPYSSPFPPAGSQTNPQVSGESPEGGKTCHSPVTGLVIRVNVEPGQAVQPNDLIMVLEAMKMETNVVAHSAATVKSVLVAPGDSVKLNQVIVEFE